MAGDSPLLESRHRWKRCCQSVLRPKTHKMAQNGAKVAQEGSKMKQNGPNMTPRWPSIDLEIIKKQWTFYVFACGVQLDPKLAQDGAKFAPNWPQDGPKMAQDGPKSLCWAILGPSCGHLGPS